MIRESAPAKVNLVLQVGQRRDDGLHEICSLFASLELADELVFQAGDGAADSVRCEGVEGENLVIAALRLFRERADANLPPLHVEIDKRIPVAGGMGGGSADAAAALRAANELAGRPLDADALRRLAAGVGADVPSKVEPAHAAGQPAPHPRVRRAAQPRARPELPDRRQHPRRHRPRR